MLRIWAIFPARPVIVPEPAQSMQELGFPSCGWLNRLKTSARNWALARSVMLKFLVIAKSTFAYLGPKKEVRLPNVSCAGRVNPLPEAPLVVNAATGVKNCLKGHPLAGVCNPPTLVFTLPVLAAQHGPASISEPHSL